MTVTTVKKFDYRAGFCAHCRGTQRFFRSAGAGGPWACLECWSRAGRAAAERRQAAPYSTRGGGVGPATGSGLRVVVSLSRDQLARIRPAGRALTSEETAAATRALAGEIADAFCRQVGRAAVMNRARAKTIASQRARAARAA